MSPVRASIALLLGLQALAALAALQDLSDDPPAKAMMSFKLAATRYNAGKTGSAVLTPSGAQTGVSLTLSGVPSGTSAPIHVYTFLVEGRCGSRGAERPLRGPARAESLTEPWALGAYRGAVRVNYRVDEAFEALRRRPFALSVRLGPEDGGHEIYCGDSPR